MLSTLLVTAGVGVVSLVLALAVLVTALQPLETVVETVEDDVSSAFWTGLVVQLLAAPALAIGAAALAITIVGILLVPLLALAWVLALAGAATLGGVAVACVIGRSRLRGENARTRAGLLRAVTIGSVTLWLPWFAAAALVSVPGLGLTARLLAVALTWSAMTVGLGAVVRSRGARQVPRRTGGSAPVRTEEARPALSARRFDEMLAGDTGSRATAAASERAATRAAAASTARGAERRSSPPDWQTPTPVMGVVAARRVAPSDPTALDHD